MGVVVVPRADETPEAEQPPELFVALPAPGDVATFSSTKIRQWLSQRRMTAMKLVGFKNGDKTKMILMHKSIFIFQFPYIFLS